MASDVHEMLIQYTLITLSHTRARFTQFFCLLLPLYLHASFHRVHIQTHTGTPWARQRHTSFITYQNEIFFA